MNSMAKFQSMQRKKSDSDQEAEEYKDDFEEN